MTENAETVRIIDLISQYDHGCNMCSSGEILLTTDMERRAHAAEIADARRYKFSELVQIGGYRWAKDMRLAIERCIHARVQFELTRLASGVTRLRNESKDITIMLQDCDLCSAKGENLGKRPFIPAISASKARALKISLPLISRIRSPLTKLAIVIPQARANLTSAIP